MPGLAQTVILCCHPRFEVGTSRIVYTGPSEYYVVCACVPFVRWNRARAKQPQGFPVTGAAGSPALQHIGRERMGGIGLLCSNFRFNLNPCL